MKPLHPRTAILLIPILIGSTSTVRAIDWDKAYEGDVLPNLATPAWSHANAGGTTSLGLDGQTTFLAITNGNPAANNSWDAPSDTVLAGNISTAFEYNDPDAAGEQWVLVQGQAFTLEWRMRINGPATLTPSGQTGIKLTYLGYPGGKFARFDWYYDAVNQRLPNNQQTWGSHAGKTGPEGSETDLANDGFPDIGLGEWHTYRVVSVNMSGKWHRELWLDGNYVGRWWDDKSSSSGPELKMRANNTTLPDTSVDFDYVRWAGKPDGRYVRPVMCPPVPTFTAVSPDQIQLPAQQVQLTLSGANLGEFLTAGSSVSLVQGTTVIQGSGLALNGADLVATFDLSGAPEGFYDLNGTQAGGCYNPVRLLQSVRYKPGTNLLKNSVFEGGIAPWSACQHKSVPEFGYTSHGGAGYISAVSNWGENQCVAEQTVTGFAYGPTELTLSLWGLVWDNSFGGSSGYESYVTGEILLDGTPVATARLDTITGVQLSYQNPTAQWSGTLDGGHTLAVRLTLRGDGRGDGGWGLVNVDDVELIAGTGCNKPFADADGDHDVDQVDFAAFQSCYTGSVGTLAAGCGCFDRAGNLTVDEADLAAFLDCVTGPAVAWEPANAPNCTP